MSKGEAAFLEISRLFNAQGDDEYIGEPVSQLQHCLQAAHCAQMQKEEEDVILAALLHDIGHLVGKERDLPSMAAFGVMNHEIVGKHFLNDLGFSKRVCKLVGSHVNAKRYRCGKDESYYEKLSSASKETLKYQGGAFTTEECEKFESDEDFTTILSLRTWDEAAKEEGLEVPGLEAYKAMILENVGK